MIHRLVGILCIIKSKKTIRVNILSVLISALSFIDVVKKNHVKKTPTLLLQIESIKKTETGYYCQFSDSSGVIYGTLNKWCL